jgi:motility quorum-sensing regulator / GCU-specific mRNA interferase toxin
MGKDEPTYDLAWIQYKLSTGRYRIERIASQGALALGFDEEDIVACVCSLSRADFHKSMESELRAGLWHDVYRPTYEGVRVYVKVQIDRSSDAIVIQFKKK